MPLKADEEWVGAYLDRIDDASRPVPTGDPHAGHREYGYQTGVDVIAMVEALAARRAG